MSTTVRTLNPFKASQTFTYKIRENFFFETKYEKSSNFTKGRISPKIGHDPFVCYAYNRYAKFKTVSKHQTVGKPLIQYNITARWIKQQQYKINVSSSIKLNDKRK